MSPGSLLRADLVALILFAVAAYFTRAGTTRTGAALAGGAAAAVYNVLADGAAARFAWWSYPTLGTWHAPALAYVAVAFSYGGAIALIGWRLTRRFGWRGQIGWIAVMSLLGFARDSFYAARTGLLAFAPGIAPRLADLAGWILLYGVSHSVMRALAGPADADRLAHSRR